MTDIIDSNADLPEDEDRPTPALFFGDDRPTGHFNHFIPGKPSEYDFVVLAMVNLIATVPEDETHERPATGVYQQGTVLHVDSGPLEEMLYKHSGCFFTVREGMGAADQRIAIGNHLRLLFGLAVSRPDQVVTVVYVFSEPEES